MAVFRTTERRLALRAAFFLFAGGLVSAQTSDQLALQSQRAKQLMAEGHFAEAIPLYEQLVKAVPGNSGLILNLGLAEEMAGHPEKAVPHFETVLKAQPENVPALTSLGTARLQMNQPRLAIAPLKKLLILQPDNQDARGMLAGSLMATGQFNQAAEQYRKLTTSNPADVKAWYGLGKTYESLASATFEKLTRLNPESPYVAALVADSRVQRGQYRSAFFFYKQAADKVPDLRGVHAGLSKIYQETGHPDWAAEEQRKEAALPAPTCASRPAECRFVAGKFVEAAQAAAASNTPESMFWATKAYNELALDAFRRLGEFPESVELHAIKAEILRSHNQHLEAANEWRAALKLAPEDPQLERELATSLFLARDFQSAVPMLEQQLKADPAAPDLNFMVGESFLRTEQPDKALPYLEAAVKADNKMVPAHASLGMALATLNRTSEAIPELEIALPVDDDGSLHYQLARAYQQAGNSQKAREVMEKYQQIRKQNEDSKEEVAKEAQITAPQ
jgi:tetratricopeptide (TPR) repeat protein